MSFYQPREDYSLYSDWTPSSSARSVSPCSECSYGPSSDDEARYISRPVYRPSSMGSRPSPMVIGAFPGDDANFPRAVVQPGPSPGQYKFELDHHPYPSGRYMSPMLFSTLPRSRHGYRGKERSRHVWPAPYDFGNGMPHSGGTRMPQPQWQHVYDKRSYGLGMDSLASSPGSDWRFTDANAEHTHSQLLPSAEPERGRRRWGGGNPTKEIDTDPVNEHAKEPSLALIATRSHTDVGDDYSVDNDDGSTACSWEASDDEDGYASSEYSSSDDDGDSWGSGASFSDDDGDSFLFAV